MTLHELSNHLIGILIGFVRAYYKHTGEDIPVSDKYPDTDDLGEQRPRVIVYRGNLKRHEMGLRGDRADALGGAPGNEAYLSLVTASVVVNCLSRAGLEAERIAMEIAQQIFVYDQDIAKKSSAIHHIGGVEVGAEEKLEVNGEKTEWASVSVTIPISCSLHTTVAPVGQILWTNRNVS